jgi:hypothetical protein
MILDEPDEPLLVGKVGAEVKAEYPVALVGDGGNCLDDRSAEPGVKGVELEDIGPGREVRIAPAGIDPPCQRCEGGRITLGIVGASLNEMFRIPGDPQVVRRHVVWY